MTAARLGLGTVQFGLDYGISNTRGKVSLAEARVILTEADRAGVGLLDTAAAYGEAESVLGGLRPESDAFTVVTKTLRLAEGLDAVLAGIERSRKRLRRKNLDTILVHAASDLTRPEGAALWERLRNLQAAEAIARIGFSAYHGDNIAELAERFRPDVVQVAASFLDQRLVRNSTLVRLKELEIEVHARSIFLQGLIFLHPDRLPSTLMPITPHLAMVRVLLAEVGLSPLAAALAWALAQEEIDRIVVGVTSLVELREILAAASGATTTGVDWAALALDDPVALDPSRWQGAPA